MNRFRSMGCEVVVGGDPEPVRALFEQDDLRFSRFSDDSELTRVNAAAAPAVVVSPPFARAVRAAIHAARQTRGLVDPTLLDAVEACGYDRDFADLDDARPPRAGARGRWRDLRLRGRLLTRPPGLRLDLNGVVKSMTVDNALATIGEGWVSAGGDVATSRPLEVALPGGGSIRLERGGLATSSSATRAWRRGGELQHHLIDPRTGAPARSLWQQVTVCGATCVMADVAAKAAFLLGADGPAWLDERGMPGRFMYPDGSVEYNGAWRGAAHPEAACT